MKKSSEVGLGTKVKRKGFKIGNFDDAFMAKYFDLGEPEIMNLNEISDKVNEVNTTNVVFGEKKNDAK